MRPETIEAVRRLVNAGGYRTTRDVIVEHWGELTSGEARWLLEQQLPRHAARSREHRVISARLHALEQCMRDGPAATFAAYDETAEAIDAIVNAADWTVVRATIERGRHLVLSEMADVALADLVMQPLAPDQESQVLGAWNLIEQCREVGVDAAIESQMQPRRGVVITGGALENLANAQSAEELEHRIRESPDVAARIARRVDGQAQLQRWAGRDAYAAAMQALSAPHDLAERVATCRAALADVDPADLPIVWALVALDLADALRAQAGYDEPSPMGEVIALYRQALDRLTPEGEPDQFVHAQRHLGDAYMLDASGDPAANVEYAVGCYETALGMLRPAVESDTWAATATHLGEALLRRTDGDTTLHAERAITLLEEAVAILERRDRPALLATARMSLAAAYRRRVHGDPGESVRAAARHLRDAAEGIAPDEHPDVWAMATTQLGEVYLTRAESELASRASLLRQSEQCFRAVLSRERIGRRARARAHAGLGWALGDQAEITSDAGDAGGTGGEAVASYEAAIAELETLGTAYDIERAEVQRNLALLYADRARRDDQAIAAAERHFAAALEIFSADGHSRYRRDTLRPLGMMYFDAGRWSEALERFDEAIALSGGVLEGQYTERGKESEVAANRSLYAAAAYCLLRLGRPGEALTTIERGKARMLADALAWKEPVASADDASGRALAHARAEAMRIEAELRASAAARDTRLHARLGERLRDATAHLNTLRAAQGGSPGPLAVAEMLAEIPPDGALVAPVVTTRGGAAIVVPAGAERVTDAHVVDLPALDARAIAAMLSGADGTGTRGWLNAYLRWLNDAESDDGAFEALIAALHELTTTLWERLMGAVHDRLTALGVHAGAPVLLVPSGWLGLLPLHAAQRPVEGNWRAFSDDFVVCHAPSVAAARVCRLRLGTPERQATTCVVIANPTGDLRFAAHEASAIAGVFATGDGEPDDVRVIAGGDATAAAVFDAVAGRQYVHFACHAQFHWSNPAESGLRLAEDSAIRIEDILSPAMDLRSARLVTLSACETGMTEFRTMPDEFVGLAGAFIEAGAAAVVSSLWPVDDVSTSLLMAELYRLHLGGMPVPEALRSAQRWLREATAERLGLAAAYRGAAGSASEADTVDAARKHYEEHPDVVPFAHPYYWAGFSVTGAGRA